MTFSRIFPLLLLILLGNIAISQEIVIKTLDESEYPLIKISIEFTGFSKISINDLKVLENNELSAFSLDSVLINKEKRLVSLLIDESLLFEQNSLNEILKAINHLTNLLNKDDLINVFVANRNTESGACLTPLSFEYTSDYQLFNIFVKDYLSKLKVSAKKPEINCAVMETINFIKSKNLPTSQKSLFVFASKNPAEIEFESESRQKAENSAIALIQINFPWNNELAKDGNNNLQDLLSRELSSIKTNIGLEASELDKTYIISYFSNQEKKQNTIEIKYLDKTLTTSYSRSDQLKLLKDNLLIFVIIGALLLVAIFLIINLLITRRQMAKSITKLKNKKEFETIDKSHLFDEPFHPNKTLYGNGSIVPYVTIDLDGDIIKHELKKLRTTLGRHSDNDILLANLTISNHHAAITNEGGIFYIQDNESTNGTFVNEIKITKATIKSGDSVRLGKAKLFLTY